MISKEMHVHSKSLGALKEMNDVSASEIARMRSMKQFGGTLTQWNVG